MDKRTKTIGVVGAGIAGLSCAFELKKAGHQVEVFERERTVGGRMASRRLEDLPFDVGAQFVSKSYEAVLAYCRELGVSEQWKELSGLTNHLYHEGRLHLASYHSIREFFRYSYLPLFSRWRLLLFIAWLRMRARKIDFFDLATGVDFDQQNAYDFTVRWAGKEIADKVVDALISAYHFHSGKEMSLSAFLGCLNEFSQKFTFHHFVTDMSSLPEALAAELCIHQSEPIRSVSVANKEVILQGRHQEFSFDQVVLATPGPVTQRIFPGASEAQRRLLDHVRYASTINVGFRVPEAATEGVSLVIVPESDSRAICSYLLPLRCEGKIEGAQTLNVFLRESYAKELMDLPDQAIYSLVQEELVCVCPPLEPFAADICPHDLQRWPEAMPKFLPHYIREVKRFWDSGQGDHGVFFLRRLFERTLD